MQVAFGVPVCCNLFQPLTKENFMKYIKYIVDVSIPGTFSSPQENEHIKKLQKDLAYIGIKAKFVDSVLGWGCLNQDWLEFESEIDISWGWCQFFKGELGKYYEECFHHGHLIMILHYIDDNGKLQAHH